jgi:hypothetical protein
MQKVSLAALVRRFGAPRGDDAVAIRNRDSEGGHPPRAAASNALSLCESGQARSAAMRGVGHPPYLLCGSPTKLAPPPPRRPRCSARGRRLLRGADGPHRSEASDPLRQRSPPLFSVARGVHPRRSRREEAEVDDRRFMARLAAADTEVRAWRASPSSAFGTAPITARLRPPLRAVRSRPPLSRDAAPHLSAVAARRGRRSARLSAQSSGRRRTRTAWRTSPSSPPTARRTHCACAAHLRALCVCRSSGADDVCTILGGERPPPPALEGGRASAAATSPPRGSEGVLLCLGRACTAAPSEQSRGSARPPSDCCCSRRRSAWRRRSARPARGVGAEPPLPAAFTLHRAELSRGGRLRARPSPQILPRATCANRRRRRTALVGHIRL